MVSTNLFLSFHFLINFKINLNFKIYFFLALSIYFNLKFLQIFKYLFLRPIIEKNFKFQLTKNWLKKLNYLHIKS
jgi:hypothetical protein